MHTVIQNTGVNECRETCRDIFIQEKERQKNAFSDVIDKAISYGRFANKANMFADIKSTILAFINKRDSILDRTAEYEYWLKLLFNSRIPTNVFSEMLIALNDMELIEEINIRGTSNYNAIAEKLESLDETLCDVDCYQIDKAEW